MKEYKQIFDLDELSGRQIIRAVTANDEFYLFLDGDYFAVISCHGYYGEHSTELKDNVFSLEITKYSIHRLFEGTFLSMEEYNILKAKYAKEDDSRIIEEELRLLSQLKEKYKK